MNKENILFGIIGVLLGCIVGFVFANTVNQRGYTPPKQDPTAQSPNGGLPPNHPPLDQNDTGGGAPASGAPVPEIAAHIQKAKDEPANFDAQMTVAKDYYQIQRFPEAIQYLTKAVAINPKDFTVLSALGNANYDLKNFPEAEKWYRAALEVNPNSVEVRTDLGSTFMERTPPDPNKAITEYEASLRLEPNHEPTLENLARALIQKGDRAGAQSTLDRLAQVNPNNQQLSGLRSQLAAAKYPRRRESIWVRFVRDNLDPNSSFICDCRCLTPTACGILISLRL
jgi:tetratricopeptide (TPR) repeat protein